MSTKRDNIEISFFSSQFNDEMHRLANIKSHPQMHGTLSAILFCVGVYHPETKETIIKLLKDLP